MTERCQPTKYALDETAELRLDQPDVGPDDPAPVKQPDEAPALHPAIGLLVAVSVSVLFWTVVTWLIVWLIR